MTFTWLNVCTFLLGWWLGCFLAEYFSRQNFEKLVEININGTFMLLTFVILAYFKS